MMNDLFKKGSALVIILVFFGVCIVPHVSGMADFGELKVKGKDVSDIAVEQYIALLEDDEVLQQHIQQILDGGVSAYLTLSISGRGRAVHIFLKMPRPFTQRGIFFGALISYKTISAATVVIEFNNETGIHIADSAIGRHMLFIFGMGYSTCTRNIFGGKGGVITVSFTKPLVIG